MAYLLGHWATNRQEIAIAGQQGHRRLMLSMFDILPKTDRPAISRSAIEGPSGYGPLGRNYNSLSPVRYRLRHLLRPPHNVETSRPRPCEIWTVWWVKRAVRCVGGGVGRGTRCGSDSGDI